MVHDLYGVKGLVTRNTMLNMKALSHSSKVITKVEVVENKGQMSRSLSQKLWYCVKGLVTRNTCEI